MSLQSERIKLELDKIDCLKSKKRKHIDFLKARWIYQIDTTDIYLIYLTGYKDDGHGCMTSYNYRYGHFTMNLNGWCWHRVIKGYHGEIKSVKRIDFYDVLNEVDVPTEILFHINELSKLSASDDKNKT